MIEVGPVTVHIGAEVSGVDLTDLDDAAFDTIEKALHDHLVLFFRDQDLTDEQHLAFASRFGPVNQSALGGLSGVSSSHSSWASE